MCGRYTLSKAQHLAEQLREAGFIFDEFSETRITPRFNISPGQTIPLIFDFAPRTVSAAKWGLVPAWANDPKVGYKMSNARGESTFRSRSRATYVSTRVESHDALPQRTRRRNSGSLRLLLSADTVAPHG
jgi:putative SOS response-associated peptidase YedK